MRWKTHAEKYLLVVQQQHDWVQLFAGPIVRAKGDDEVIQSVPCRLRRNNNQFVLKPIGFGIFKAVVLAALCGGMRRGDSARGPQPPTHRPPPWGGCSPTVPCPASGSRKGLSRAKGGTELGSSQCRGSLVGSPSRTCGREKNPAAWMGELSAYTQEKHLKAADPGLKHITGKCFATLSCSSWRLPPPPHIWESLLLCNRS